MEHGGHSQIVSTAALIATYQAEAMLRSGVVNVDSRDAHGNTMLMVACQNHSKVSDDVCVTGDVSPF